MFWTCLSVCHTHWHYFSVHLFRRRTLSIYMYHVKARGTNGNNLGFSFFSCGKKFRRNWRLEVGNSDIALM